MAIIGIDFDGTCVTDLFPYVGDNIGAASVKRQKELEERLAYLIDKPFLTKEEHDEMVKIGNELPKSPPTTLSFNIRLDKMAK